MEGKMKTKTIRLLAVISCLVTVLTVFAAIPASANGAYRIDIKPGNSQNTINLGSEGVVPVAIFTTYAVDATTIDPSSIELEGAGVHFRGKSGNYGSFKDVDGDGYLDLVVNVETEALGLISGDIIATLTALYWDSEFQVWENFEAIDTVRIVPPEQ
jgi:hypothetical protein